MKTLTDIRASVFSNRKVICTGNPNSDTIASAVKKMYPTATFIHLSNGWDLTDTSQDNKLAKLFTKHNTFINASYIAPYVQSRLLDICHSSVKFCDVFNIGSTHEYDELGTIEYKESKLDLRSKSLAYNTFRFKTHHIIIGKIGSEYITLDRIIDTIKWISCQDLEIPLMAIEYPKEPW